MGYQALCRELAAAGPVTFGELSSIGARSVLRRYSDAWFGTARRRAAGEVDVRFPRRRRALISTRYYHGTFSLSGRRLQLPTASGARPLVVRLARGIPYLEATVRSVTLLSEGGRLFVDVTAEVAVADYDPIPGRVAGVDLGVIHPYAVACPDTGQALLVSGRALRAENRLHLAESKARHSAAAAGLGMVLVDERGTSTTCPAGGHRTPKPHGRRFFRPVCGYTGHRDVTGAANIAARGGGTPTGTPLVITAPSSRTAPSRHRPVPA